MIYVCGPNHSGSRGGLLWVLVSRTAAAMASLPIPTVLPKTTFCLQQQQQSSIKAFFSVCFYCHTCHSDHTPHLPSSWDGVWPFFSLCWMHPLALFLNLIVEFSQVLALCVLSATIKCGYYLSPPTTQKKRAKEILSDRLVPSSLIK